MAMTLNDLLNIIDASTMTETAKAQTGGTEDIYLKAEVSKANEDIQMIGAPSAVILQQRIDAFKDCCQRGIQVLSVEIKGNGSDWMALIKVKIIGSYYYRVGMREYKDWITAH